MPKLSVPEPAPEQKDYQYVEIPTMDLFGEAYPPLQINAETFMPGQTYLVKPDIASELNRIKLTFQRAQMRILQPRQDAKAVAAMEKYGTLGGIAKPVAATE